ncbi:aminoglycoside 6-adenylyltransferase [Paenibacillus sp. GCM10023248]|uniref:aminoglycoside 6-adenylyltransferase n=1 Tax=Bacillales TaxID=1385 RepID=UPI002378318B|nr:MULTISPECIES: aminoglycoside 6-adenylyltransferase [Bacillales]MDD9268052.1 aminoglycoside 6-adenylyltransferase [Paenibacillus sp. MAHUQ-63]MDR6879725.1 aminoglycoside 6-adenylyltransferase [Bacillus sp. 3255]
MRTEKEMMDFILAFAEENDCVRAVIMNGSRVNPEAPRDIFQDYDIVFFVTSVAAFVEDRSWIERFGELIIMQTPDEMDGEWMRPLQRFAFLMQFTDGNRIDLTFCAADSMDTLSRDSLSKLLLDKDGSIEPFAEPSNSDYLTKPPTAAEFAACCNEFWWVSTYIAKGLWRRELSYAKFMYERPVRDMLVRMLQWHIGIRTGFTADSGKCGKYFEQWLEPRLWEAFVRTYPDGDYDHIWEGLETMCGLFRETAKEVAQYGGFAYNVQEDERVSAHLAHVRQLPQDAAAIYE